MPQMFPLNWILLPLFFIILLLIIFIMNYYNFLQPKSTKSTNISFKAPNWLW